MARIPSYLNIISNVRVNIISESLFVKKLSLVMNKISEKRFFCYVYASNSFFFRIFAAFPC